VSLLPRSCLPARLFYTVTPVPKGTGGGFESAERPPTPPRDPSSRTRPLRLLSCGRTLPHENPFPAKTDLLKRRTLVLARGQHPPQGPSFSFSAPSPGGVKKWRPIDHCGSYKARSFLLDGFPDVSRTNLSTRPVPPPFQSGDVQISAESFCLFIILPIPKPLNTTWFWFPKPWSIRAWALPLVSRLCPFPSWHLLAPHFPGSSGPPKETGPRL